MTITKNQQLKKNRIMSGMRPTGKLHLGHYMGVLKNWISFQDDYECFFHGSQYLMFEKVYLRLPPPPLLLPPPPLPLPPLLPPDLVGAE